MSAVTVQAFRPSLFLTLTLDTYGAVHGRRGGGACRCGERHGKDDPILGTPLDPNHYDYTRAARDALHFSKLVDRFIQNLRRFVGYDVQYFAAIEPQRRYAPHVHMAIRGTVSRAELRQVVAATYAQVWWPSTDTVQYAGADCRSGTPRRGSGREGNPAGPTSTPPPESRYPPGTRLSTRSATRTTRCTWSGSVPKSTRKASSATRRTPGGASAT